MVGGWLCRWQPHGGDSCCLVDGAQGRGRQHVQRVDVEEGQHRGRESAVTTPCKLAEAVLRARKTQRNFGYGKRNVKDTAGLDL